MSICRKCGMTNDGTPKFCSYCGAKLELDAGAGANSQQNGFWLDSTVSEPIKMPKDNAALEYESETSAPKKKNTIRNIIIVLSCILAVLMAIGGVVFLRAINASNDYKKANKLVEQGKYTDAVAIYKDLGDYKDCKTKIKQCNYDIAGDLADSKKYDDAIKLYNELGDYKQSKEKVKLCNYEKANELLEAQNYSDALSIYAYLGDYKQSADKLNLCNYNLGLEAFDNCEYEKAVVLFKVLEEYEDAKNYYYMCNRNILYDYLNGCKNSMKTENLPGTQLYLKAVQNRHVVIGVNNEDSVIFEMTLNMSGDEGSFNLVYDSQDTFDGTYTVSLVKAGDGLKSLNLDAIEITRTVYGKDDYIVTEYEKLADEFIQLVGQEVIGQLLKQTQLGITPKDLGFLNY